jgi:hypothetical protein
MKRTIKVLEKGTKVTKNERKSERRAGKREERKILMKPSRIFFNRNVISFVDDDTFTERKKKLR